MIAMVLCMKSSTRCTWKKLQITKRVLAENTAWRVFLPSKAFFVHSFKPTTFKSFADREQRYKLAIEVENLFILLRVLIHWKQYISCNNGPFFVCCDVTISWTPRVLLLADIASTCNRPCCWNAKRQLSDLRNVLVRNKVCTGGGSV